MAKYNKIPSKIYKHLEQQTMQQKVQRKGQQKVHNNYDVRSIKRFLFTK